MYIFIFANTRSGSTCLGKWLADSVGLPFADEWFGDYFEKSNHDLLSVEDPRHFIQNAYNIFKSNYPNGAVVKIMFHDLQRFNGRIPFGPFSILLEEFAKNVEVVPIYLSRKNLIDSALSEFVASKVGTWHLPLDAGTNYETHDRSQNEISFIKISDIELEKILLDYEGRVFSAIFSKISLFYYFNTRLRELEYNFLLDENLRNFFLYSNFPLAKASTLSYRKVILNGELLKKQIPFARIRIVDKKIKSFLTDASDWGG